MPLINCSSSVFQTGVSTPLIMYGLMPMTHVQENCTRSRYQFLVATLPLPEIKMASENAVSQKSSYF